MSSNLPNLSRMRMTSEPKPLTLTDLPDDMLGYILVQLGSGRGDGVCEAVLNLCQTIDCGNKEAFFKLLLQKLGWTYKPGPYVSSYRSQFKRICSGIGLALDAITEDGLIGVKDVVFGMAPNEPELLPIWTVALRLWRPNNPPVIQYQPMTDALLSYELANFMSSNGNSIMEVVSRHGPPELWNVSQVTNMAGLFAMYPDFNLDISMWNVSNVTNMSTMFRGCVYFNRPVGRWITSGVTDFRSMFEGATAFSQDLRSWDVRSAEMAYMMFAGAIAMRPEYVEGWQTQSQEGANARDQLRLMAGQLALGSDDDEEEGEEVQVDPVVPMDVGREWCRV